MENKLLKRIVIDPEVMVGKPVIRGTRIPVDMIIKLFAQGMIQEEVLKDYPHICKEDIQAALMYGAETVSNEEVFPLLVGEK